MKTYDLKGKVRDAVGKKSTTAIRANKGIPSVLYGVNDNVHFSVKNSDVHRLIYTPEVYIVNLDIDGKKTTAIMQDIQFHPVTDAVLHIDFLEVSKDKPVVFEIPVRLNGMAAGVRQGGNLSLITRRLRVKGLYTDFPDFIDIDITNLLLGESIQVSDLDLGKLKILNPKDAVITQVKLTRVSLPEDEVEDDEDEDEEGEEGAEGAEESTEGGEGAAEE